MKAPTRLEIGRFVKANGFRAQRSSTGNLPYWADKRQDPGGIWIMYTLLDAYRIAKRRLAAREARRLRKAGYDNMTVNRSTWFIGYDFCGTRAQAIAHLDVSTPVKLAKPEGKRKEK
ncbi:MAG: hypothetical protein ABIY63_13280 [Fibrobacteria bacterium]